MQRNLAGADGPYMEECGVSISNEPISLQWARAAEHWVDLDSAATLLEETKSAVLSQMMMRLVDGRTAVNRAEMEVKASPEWHTHITKLTSARKAANMAKVRMEFLRLKFFEDNSRAATERVTARM